MWVVEAGLLFFDFGDRMTKSGIIAESVTSPSDTEALRGLKQSSAVMSFGVEDTPHAH